jgi:hypothetical protein
MIFSTKESLEERFVRYLLDKEQTVKGLRKQLADEGWKITIQGVYKALRTLVAHEVVIKRGTLYSLSEEWRNRSIDTLSKSNNRFELAEGEKISFDLASLIHLDQQWKNVVLPLHEAYPTAPVFFYNPHEIWIHLNDSRKASEIAYFGAFKENKAYAFCLIGGNTEQDKSLKKELQNEYVQVAIGAEHFSKTDYPTIFGDYIITTRISPRLAEEIEKCYKESATTASLEAGLQKIGIEKKKVRLVIERDRQKAKKLRKKLSKEFFVPQKLIEEFGLF